MRLSIRRTGFRTLPGRGTTIWLEAGQQATRETTVTADDVRAYAELTGDRDPLHFDEGFARRTRYGRLLAQGGITTGLLHALVAMELPGPGSVFARQRWSCPHPVYIGDTIRAEITVTRTSERRRFAELAVEVRNQLGELVLEGEATVFHAQPEH